MCGRYLFDLKTTELLKYYQQLQQLGKIGEVAPSENVVTLAPGKDGKIRLGLTRWGFTTTKNKSRIINARSETVTEKPLFAESFYQRRCVFPMTGFFEWDHDKNKILFTPTDEKEIYVGGFYRQHNDELESVIMTTSPNETVAKIHDRMPLIIEKKAIRTWLTDDNFANCYRKQQLEPKLTLKKSMPEK